MLELALVTCGPQLEVALVGGPLSAPSLVRLAGVAPRSSLLLAAVDLLFEDAGVERRSLERILVSRGPGSFTGIRSGLASAAGLALASGAEVRAYDSLLTQAARATGDGEVWAAQPGRRGEVYAQRFAVAVGQVPRPLGELQVVAVAEAPHRGPWLAAESLDLGGAPRHQASLSAAEGLLRLAAAGAPGQPLEPLYVEGPPIHGKVGRRCE